jgi:hypothetical protein
MSGALGGVIQNLAPEFSERALRRSARLQEHALKEKARRKAELQFHTAVIEKLGIKDMNVETFRTDCNKCNGRGYRGREVHPSPGAFIPCVCVTKAIAEAEKARMEAKANEGQSV